MKKSIKIAMITIVAIASLIAITCFAFKLIKNVSITDCLEPGVYPSVYSCLNKMPSSDLFDKHVGDSGNKGAYYIISFDNMEYEKFIEKYELTQVDVNGAKCSKIYDEGSQYSIKYRVYSTNYKDNNEVKLYVLDKESGKTKELIVKSPLEVVY